MAFRALAVMSRFSKVSMEACVEVILNAVVALTPVWAGVLVSILVNKNIKIGEAVFVSAERGDLYLLAAASLAPLILYLTLQRGQNMPRRLTIKFPAGWFFILSILIIFGVCSVMFAIKRASEVPESALQINSELFFWMSIAAYALSILLSLIIIVIKNHLDNLRPSDLRNDTKKFVEQFARTNLG